MPIFEFDIHIVSDITLFVLHTCKCFVKLETRILNYNLPIKTKAGKKIDKKDSLSFFKRLTREKWRLQQQRGEVVSVSLVIDMIGRLVSSIVVDARILIMYKKNLSIFAQLVYPQRLYNVLKKCNLPQNMLPSQLFNYRGYRGCTLTLK